MKLRKIGGSVLVTIPKALVGALGWKLGDELEVKVLGSNALRVSRTGKPVEPHETREPGRKGKAEPT